VLFDVAELMVSICRSLPSCWRIQSLTEQRSIHPEDQPKVLIICRVNMAATNCFQEEKSSAPYSSAPL
jgi:hypothetical protein